AYTLTVDGIEDVGGATFTSPPVLHFQTPGADNRVDWISPPPGSRSMHITTDYVMLYEWDSLLGVGLATNRPAEVDAQTGAILGVTFQDANGPVPGVSDQPTTFDSRSRTTFFNPGPGTKLNLKNATT